MAARLVCLTSVLALTAGSAWADMNFNRIASFATPLNMAAGEDTARESSAEIVAASGDGMRIAYSDSPLGVIGRIDITDPANPRPLGNVAVDGEPTAVSMLGNTIFTSVNTSASFVEPSGVLHAIDIVTGETLASCDLGGQPDSTAIAPDGSFIAIAIENERDEEAGDGRVPQMPGGFVAIFAIENGLPVCESMIRADVTGLAEIAPEDPEPEFVDINADGEIVVTMQENNHIVILGRDGSVLSHFSAGTVDLTGVDAADDGALVFGDTLAAIPREPDGIQWIDTRHVVVANEGDMDGGSRGFTVFDRDGTVVYESGASFEHAIVRIGHYPDGRSDAKGVEPEGMEFAVFDGTPYAFILSERASIVGVYDMTDPANPVLAQLLPSGVSPEGAIAIPSRNLLVTANEADLGEDGLARAHVMIYEYQDAPAAYPMLTSEGADTLIGWGANSGMVAGDDGLIYAVSDSVYGAQPRIVVIDPAQTPARIVRAIDVTRDGAAAAGLDLEGITLDGQGGFWLASEGRTDRDIAHALYRVDAEGAILETVGFPEALLAHEIRFGAEGITRVGDTLWIALQRPWNNDPANHVQLVAYNTATGEWGAVHYPTTPAETGWVGLSEIAAHGEHVYLVERDNQIGAAARVKRITRVALSEMVPAPLGGPLPVVTPELVRDLLPDLAMTNGYIVDKVEGLAIFPDGTVWISTDNDGVDDSSGETLFWSFRLD